MSSSVPSPKLRVVFAGTPEFSVPCLRAVIAAGVDVVAVYTQPDRPAGRGRKLAPSPVKQAAIDAGITVEQPETLRDPAAQARLRELAPDLLIVVAYGLILSKTVLAIPRLGCWNVHASSLPRWRGAAPIQRAILAGDSETGVDLMQMEAGLDTGPMLLRAHTAIAANETGGSLHDRLSLLGADLLSEGLRRLLDGTLPTAQAQDESGVTYAHKLEKSEAALDWSLPAKQLERQVRAFNPWPVAEGDIAGEHLRVHAAVAVEDTHAATPGSVISARADGVDVATGDGLLRVLAVQRAGGRRMDVRDWLNARADLRGKA
ncbi:MAG: methionyl-tRNA formyltransferase [Dokdonella sp.]